VLKSVDVKLGDFEMAGVEAPYLWSDKAVSIAARMYFAPNERSIYQMVDRVVHVIQGSSKAEENIDFAVALESILLGQRAAFNTPVWMNIGVADRTPQAWACTLGDTYMLSKNGLVKIKELTGSKVDLWTNGGWSPGFSWRTGNKKVVKVTLSNGLEIITTPDHKFEVGYMLEDAENLLGVELAPMLGNGDWEGNDLGISLDDLTRLGYLQGDGSFGATTLAHIGDKDQDVISLFGEYSAPTSAPKSYVIPRNDYLNELVDRLGMHRLRLSQRDFPTAVYTLSPNGMAAWLRGLFTANGTAAKNKEVSLRTINLDLAKCVQRCLLAFGIESTLRTQKPKTIEFANGGYECATSYEVRILNHRSRCIFSERIGFIQSYKTAILNNAIQSVAPGYPRAKFLPTVISVEDAGYADVYDFNVEDDSHIAWANGFAIHNCLILGVEDSMKSIQEGWIVEAETFRGGSGSGVNVSRIRADGEPLVGGGVGSGPISLWMRPTNEIANVVKSGGRTRRAAKMVVMDVDHPQIMEFIRTKADAENMARDLLKLGYDIHMTGKDSGNVPFQQANNSVRVRDDFMVSVDMDEPYLLEGRTTSEFNKLVPAKDIWDAIAQAAWECGDPGIQFHDTTNAANTCLDDGEITASNPCVVKSTLVSTDEGMRRIDSLVDWPQKILSFDGQYHYTEGSFRTSLSKPVYKLTTKSGYTLTLTEDHKVWTVNRGDVPAKELTTNDVLQLVPGKNGVEHLDTRVAEFLGVALGDGYMSPAGAIKVTLSPMEQSVAEYLNDSLYSFRSEYESDYRAKRHNKVNSPQTTLNLHSSCGSVVNPAKRFMILDAGAENKRFTDQAYILNNAAISSILRGLFTADGTVANYGDKSQYVSLDSVSERLLEQVQLFLLNFGIKAKIYRNRKVAGTSLLPDGKGGNREYPTLPMHSLRISRSSRVLFEREIGFLPSSEKATKLRELNANVSVYKDKLTDSFASLMYVGDEEVYDLTEDTTSHFVANGIAVHNCSEYLWLDNTVCNLASINLMKYRLNDQYRFDWGNLIHDVEIMIEAMDRLVDISSYPTELIDKTSKQYRTLGLGFTNLGALLMSKGIAYDSDAGRAWAAAIMAVMQGAATAKSQRLAEKLGAYPAWERNKKSQARVISEQNTKANKLAFDMVPHGLDDVIRLAWEKVVPDAPIRNAQLTVIAPTGTISLMMDCETTGIEPVLAINAEKTLSGGGHLDVGVADCVLAGMKALGLDSNIPLAKYDLTDKEKKVFETALGDNVVAPEGHVRMMAAVQPFVSGGISKTVNLPSSATVEDVKAIYKLAWGTECKAIAIFRDGCKAYQPVNIVREEVTTTPVQGVTAAASIPVAEVMGRKKPPATRPAVTNEFDINGERYYVSVSYYPDTGKPCEIFIHGRKHGSAIAGWIDTASILFSKLLQRGVPIEELVRDFQRTNFAPQGMVISDSPIKSADSPLDYIVRWIPQTYPGGISYVEPPAATTQQLEVKATYTIESLSGEECFDCGSSNTRWAGTCRVCSDCGTTSGCS